MSNFWKIGYARVFLTEKNMTNKCDSSSGNPTFVVYYWGGANNTLRQLLWEALVVQFVCCDVWPQPYSSFAFMRGPSHTVRLPLWGPQPNSLFAVMWVFFGGGSPTVRSNYAGPYRTLLPNSSLPLHPLPLFFSVFTFFLFAILAFFLGGMSFRGIYAKMPILLESGH